jgi:Co/Zn/Cd efflux system component
MVVEAAAALWAAVTAGSLSLLAFGLDSGVELASAGVLVWRLRSELDHHCEDAECQRTERVERSAARVAAVLLFALALYVGVAATMKLFARTGEAISVLGLAVTIVSIPIMIALSNAKRKLSAALDSGALRADAAQGTACWYLAVAVLAGIALQAWFGAWWADAAASLVIVIFLVREGREAWQGIRCC